MGHHAPSDPLLSAGEPANAAAAPAEAKHAALLPSFARFLALGYVVIASEKQEMLVQKTADIHLSVPEDLLAGLDRVARQSGMRRAHIMREAIVNYLRRIDLEEIEREMHDYVEALAPFSGEFVKETDSYTVQHLLRETEW